MSSIQNRYEFVYLFDVEMGNPNGDPDADNMPRMDPETCKGIVTDVCLKRKIRNYVAIKQKLESEQASANGQCETGEEAKSELSYDIFIKEKAVLNDLIAASHEDETVKRAKKKGEKEDAARIVMCKKYYDVRTFGAVMTTGSTEEEEGGGKSRKTAGQVRGPVQLGFARSICPIASMPTTITRMAVASQREADQQGGDNRTMGRKHIISHALYRTEGYVSAHLANGASGTGFSESDLDLLWEALEYMFEHDRSAARGKMIPRVLIVFEHESMLGNAKAHELFDLIKVTAKQKDGPPPRCLADYHGVFNKKEVPDGVEAIAKLWPKEWCIIKE